MNHHCQVHIVEFAEFDQFGLAAEELDFALAAQFVPVFDFNVFLGRNGNQSDTAAELGKDLGLVQADGGAEEHSNLAVVAAGVGGAGVRVGVGVFVDDKGVEFAEQSHRRAGRAAEQVGADAGQSQAGAERDAQFSQFAGDQLGGLELPIARFRLAEDSLGQGDNFVGPGVDGGKNLAFQFVAGGHSGGSLRVNSSGDFRL